MLNPPTQYETDHKLAARQRFWATCRRDPAFDLYEWVLDLAGIDGSARADVLDVGCGNGPYENLIAQRHHQGLVAALDASLGMLTAVVAGERTQGDAGVLPFASGSFDVVLAPHMLYHVSDVGAAARECRRVLREGGVFVAVTNGEDNIRSYLELVEEAVDTGWRMLRPAEQAFSLENGLEQLTGAFSIVERVHCPPSDVIVTDVDLLADYIASVEDHYSSEVPLPWDEVVQQARALAATAMQTNGELRWSTSVGAFVCR